MSTYAQAQPDISVGRRMLNKVPEVTLFFWVIKIMCTTVGETAADYLNVNLGFGLTNTTYVTGALLAVLLVVQFRLRRYVPVVYWSVVVVISVFGTLITDNLTDAHNVPLTTSTAIFAVILAVVFAVWYGVERTLSIHTIVTRRREAFYWLAILFTFALGTSAGDLVAEKFSIGYGPSIAIWGGAIALITMAHYGLGLNAVLAFWLAYILTRPLGASIGDFMSQSSKDYGGLGLGTTGTSYIFLGCILALVTFLSITKRDQTEVRRAEVACAGAAGGARTPPSVRRRRRAHTSFTQITMDWSLLHSLNDFLAEHDGLEDPLVRYVRAAEVLFIALLAGLFLLPRGEVRSTLRRGAVAGGASAAVALALAQVISRLVDRPRPFVEDPHGVHLFVRHAPDPGFPSDHVTAGFAIAVALLLCHRRWGMAALAMATLVAIGRVGMAVHFPSDVLAGAVLGSATALALWSPATRRLLERIADRVGEAWDGALAWAGGRIGVKL